MSPLAKGLALLFGFPIVLSIVFFTYFNATGEERMKLLCDQVTPGMTQDQLKEFSLNNKLNSPGKESGVLYLGDSRSYGRHTCKVVLDAGIVKSSEYAFAD